MKKLMIATTMLSLLSAPAFAGEASPGDFFSRLFGAAPTQQSAVYGHSAHRSFGHRHHHHFAHALYRGHHAHAHYAYSHAHTHHAHDWRASVPAGGNSFVANASYYGGGPRRFEPNSHTASGEHFNQWGLTAAHRTLPMGTRLLVSHGGRSVVVRVNDRGPAAWTGRSLDVSRGAAARLGLIGPGTGAVRVTVLGRG